MAVRVGGMYGRKRTLGYPKSYGGGCKAAGTAAPSVGRYAVQRTACPRQGAKAAFDGRNGCQKCFCVTFGKSNKTCAVSGADYPSREKGYLLERTISFMTGKGSVNHNSRKFHAKNTDPERSYLNVEYCNENVKEVYHELFDEALARYNEKQTRSDRRIDDYYEKIRSGKQEKPFHEIILQIGDKDNMGAKTENGQLAAKVLDKYMQDFQRRNPTLRVFSAYLHMDEATPHLHIDFVPYTTGSKRGLDTRVSLKQALSALGFKGGTRRETELNQWVAYEKEKLAAVMLEHGIEWEKKGTHEKHLSVLDFEKKERAKEVAELEAKKEELQEDLQESRQETEKAQKQADKYQKRMNELAPMVKNMEKLAADFSADPEQMLPEVAVMESAKSYREKKAKPLVKKIVQVMRSVYSAYLDISNKFTKLQAAYNKERSGNERLTNRLEEVLEENRELRMVAADFGRIKAVIGSEQVNAVIDRAKQQEQIEAEQKRTARRKHNREAR